MWEAADGYLSVIESTEKQDGTGIVQVDRFNSQIVMFLAEEYRWTTIQSGRRHYIRVFVPESHIVAHTEPIATETLHNQIVYCDGWTKREARKKRS